LPHTPQLVTLVEVLTSQPLAALPSQLPKPELHAARVHAPAAQPATALARLHTVPQALQWLASFWRSRQTPEQLVVGDAHDAVHVPPEHTVPAPQTLPQAPQWALSVWSARQVPEQLVCPAGHRHERPWQEAPPAQTVPQAPQLVLSAARSRHVPEQLVCPVGQTVTHAPATQLWAPEQGLPHAPQWALLVLRLASQPLAALPSQLPKPAAHAPTVHAPAAQPAVALGSEQGRSHPPQWATVVRVLVSQPLLAIPSQSPSPAVQARAHTPPTHVAVPPVVGQRFPQAPQWLTSVRPSRSQPSTARPLQSSRSLGHVSAETPQTPPLHTAVAPTGGAGQRPPHRPQFARSPIVVFTSHPFTGSPSQSAKPALHAPRTHRPAAQVAAALAKPQRLPHTPQFIGSAEVATSQPSAASPSQLPKPSRQLTRVQRLAVHPATAPGKAHWLPQDRQWLGSLVRSRQEAPQGV
jgi:hypothetical protein